MLNKDRVAEIVERNPKVDPSAIERSRDVARRLAELGIRTGDYRIVPALGGDLLKHVRSGSTATLQQEGRIDPVRSTQKKVQE
jgi:hypothetical protein